MKFIISNEYACGFNEHNLSPEAVLAGFIGIRDNGIDLRNNNSLIKMIEEGKNISKSGEDEFIVVEIPDNYTDTYIEDYDGKEALLYVIDGKIHRVGEVFP